MNSDRTPSGVSIFRCQPASRLLAAGYGRRFQPAAGYGLRVDRHTVRSGGVVLVIALLAIVLIASLLFYVINVGRSVQGRVVTQHAADAAVIGGASQAARSLNTVAMNNVETARLIAAVNLLDGVPLAVDFSITDETETGLGDTDALAQAVSAQLRASVIDVWFRDMLRDMVDASDPESVVSEQRHLRELDDLFRGQPDLVPEMTFYKAPSGEMGKMHQAMRSLDAHSRAVMQTFGQTVQSAATRSARANLGNEDTASGGAGLLLPASPSIPWQRGVFDDYERPVQRGLLPGGSDPGIVSDSVSKGFGQVDDELIRRGPYDTVFGWRDTDGRAALSGSLPGINRPPVLGQPSRARDPEYYEVFGPRMFLYRIFPPRPFSRVRLHLLDLSSIKTAYLWPGTTLRTVTDSAWEIDVDFDDERSSDRNADHVYGLPSSDIRETLFVIGEIKSRINDDPGLPQRKGLTWNVIEGNGRRSPFAIYRGGWDDPNDGPPITINPNSVESGPTWKKIQDHIWRISATYMTDPGGPDNGGDPSIGLPAKQDGFNSDGTPKFKPQEVYWEIDVMLVGVNVGKDVEVSDPWEGFDRNLEDAPAPVDFIHDQFPPNDATRAEYLTFLGVARKPSTPDFWPSRFDAGRAYPYNSAIAQARVFNNHSWDLWTQTWQAQLEYIRPDDYDDWLDRADQAVDVSLTNPDMDPDQVREIAEYLRSVQPLAPVMLNH